MIIWGCSHKNDLSVRNIESKIIVSLPEKVFYKQNYTKDLQ